MGSRWKKVKAALGAKFCLQLPVTLEETSSSVNGALIGRSSDVAAPPPSSSSAPPAARNSSSRISTGSALASSSSSNRLSKSRSRSTKKTCAICLGTMKAGQGHAIFTAECSHSFHFHCIASNVKYGNQICPICRSQWKDIPFPGPASDLPNGRARVIPVDLPQEDAMNIFLPSPTLSNSSRLIGNQPQPSEPSMFDDDEQLDCEPVLPNTSLTTRSEMHQNSSRSVEIKTYTERSAVQRSTTRPNFDILINLKAHVTSLLDSARQYASVDLVTVLDISGSMSGTKIALLKRAMGFVIQNLGPSDRLSVVAFSSTAKRIFPLRRMNDSGRQHALQAVNSLIASGGTNVVEGLRKGAKVMEDRKMKNPAESIMLLSDGKDTYTNGRVRDLGFQIPVHAFGFGTDHDPILMHSIAETSGGTFSFVETEVIMQDAFAQCIGGLLSVAVQDLRVSVECVHPSVRLGPVKAGSFATHVADDSRTGYIHVGSLYADEERDFLVSVNVPEGDSSNETALINVRCAYKDPVSEEAKTLERKEVRIERPKEVRDSVESIEVDRQKNRLEAAKAMEESRAAAEQGDLPSAVFILESCRSFLSETISARAGDQLSAALDAELKELQERMASQRVYETSGRAYVLAGLSSHSGQRATTRGDNTDSTYLTRSMTDMLSRSQVLSLGMAQSPTVNVPRFFLDEPQPR